MKLAIALLFLNCICWLGGCLPAQDSESSRDYTHSNAHTPTRQYIVNFPIPEKLEFAGEAVPLEDWDVAERLDREINAHAYYHASTLSIIKLSSRWKPTILEILQKNGIPSDFYYLAVAESALDNQAISAKNAVGMWQLLKPTAEELGLEVSSYIDQRRDPLLATEAACRYLLKSYERLGNWTLVAAAYNRGVRGLTDALTEQGVDSYYDLYLHEETYRYIFRILSYKLILETPKNYGFVFDSNMGYIPWDYQEVEVNSTIPSLPQWALERGTTYKMIKRYNPWITSIDYSLPVNSGKTYKIRLPR